MELIVEDAEFVTMAPGGRAGSMLVRDGRIAAIGPAGAGTRRGGTCRGGGAPGWCHGGPWPDRCPLPCDGRRLPGGGRGLQPAGGAGHRGGPGPAARGRSRDAAGVVGDGQRVRGVQARRAAAPDPRGPGCGRAGPPGGGLPHVAARVRAQLGGAGRGRVRRWPAGPAQRRARPRRAGQADRPLARGADVPGVRPPAPVRPGAHGRGRAGAGRAARRAAAGGAGHYRGL